MPTRTSDSNKVIGTIINDGAGVRGTDSNKLIGIVVIDDGTGIVTSDTRKLIGHVKVADGSEIRTSDSDKIIGRVRIDDGTALRTSDSPKLIGAVVLQGGGPATGISMSGPASGFVGVASSPFTVALQPGGGTVAGTVTVTPSDGGAGGTFSPSSVALTTTSSFATFTYTPASTGTKTISVTNSGSLANPSNISFVASTPAATGVSLSGPSGGVAGTPSTPFTVALTPSGGSVGATVTVTPNDGGGGGTFVPTSVGLTTGAPSATFTYTPASAGAKTIGVTNSGGLSNPAPLTYAATASGGGGLNDGDPVSVWADSSGNGHNASQTGSTRPTFKTNILNGKPVVRFTSVGQSKLSLTTTIPAVSFTCFTVMKRTGANILGLSGTDSGAQGVFVTGGSLYGEGNYGYISFTDSYSSAFAVYTTDWNPGVLTALYVNGTNIGAALTTNPTSMVFSLIGAATALSIYSDGDIAEVIIYDSPLALRLKLTLLITLLLTTGEFPSEAEFDAMVGNRHKIRHYLVQHGAHPTNAQLDAAVEPFAAGDRANVEKYLGTKYGIAVSGGTAVQPDTVAGLLGWWKADSLG